MCVFIFSTTFVWNISHFNRNERGMIKKYIGLNVKYPLFLLIVTKLEFSQQIFEKPSNIKFYENPSSGSGVVPYGRRDE